jgi:hypothetical protein
VEFFRPYADYVLREDGEFIDVNTKDSDGNIVSTQTLANHNGCWKLATNIGDPTLEGGDCNDASDPNYSTNLTWKMVNQGGGGNWKVSGGENPPAGIYFVEGNFLSTGNSSAASPWKTTIVSTANISLGGTRDFENYTDGPYDQPVKDAFMIANRDIEIGGTVANTRGFIHARDQVSLTGTINLTGWIIAAGTYASPTGGAPLPEGKGFVNNNVIGGNAHITYDDFISSPWPDCVVKVLAWKEIAGIG